MPSEAEFMRLARLECIFGATVKGKGLHYLLLVGPHRAARCVSLIRS